MGFIYKVTNKVNGKLYIGLTTLTIEKRLALHFAEAKANKDNRPFYNAIRKYGQDNFQIELIEEVDNELLAQREQFWIKELHTYVNDKESKGYNATLGGDGVIHYDYAVIAECYLSNHSKQQTAKEMDCTIKTVDRALNSFSIPTYNKSAGVKVYALDEQLNIAYEFDSIKSAAEFLSTRLNKNSQTIRKRITYVLRHAPQQKAYGFYWEEQ